MQEIIFRRDPGMVFREIAGETILVPISRNADETDSIFVLNETGARFWNSIDGVRSIYEIAVTFVEEFQVDIDTVLADLEEYAEELLAAGAIHRVLEAEGSPGN